MWLRHGPGAEHGIGTGAYVMTDRGTWLNFKNRGDLVVLVEGDTRLFNQYGVMLVNPAKHPHVKVADGQKFVDWVVSAPARPHCQLQNWWRAAVLSQCGRCWQVNLALTVQNRCRTESGFDEATGKATVVEGYGNSRLKVSFFWPFKADYWVVGLDPDYRWAVVGNPNRKYLWVLSRTPQLAPKLMEAALASASAQGFDLTQLRTTVQSSATTQEKP
jgi:hypothetical protein